MSISYWLDRSPNSKLKKFDVVIVGAGISGLSTAFWLEQEDPQLKIVIVEKNRLGFGASGRNAGFVTCGSVEHFNRLIGKHGRDEAVEIWRFAEMNLKLLEEHIVRGPGTHSPPDLLFEKKGSYSLAAAPSEYEELQKVAHTMTELKIPVQVYNERELQKAVGTEGFCGGIKYLGDAAIHPHRLLEKIHSRLKNTTLLEGTEVSSYASSGTGTRIVKTDSGPIEASMIIYALNGFSADLNPYFKDKIYPTRGQILMMEKVDRFMDGPCYANSYLDYFRQLPTGELLIGGFRQLEKASEIGFSDHTTDVIQTALHDFVKKHLPRFKDKKVTHRWGGVMGFSADGQPMVGSLPEDNHVFFLGGYTGHGMGLAFHTAKATVDMIYGREIPKWLSAKRF